MFKQALAIVLVLLLLGLVFGGIFGWKLYQAQLPQQQADHEPQPITVTTAEAVLSSWQPKLKAVGSLKAVKGIALSPEVAGRVTAIKFHSGERVKQGKRLVIQNAETEKAELRQLQAQKELAEIQLRRQRKLLQRNQTSQAEMDKAVAQVQSLAAQIDRERARIAKKRIRAPFSGVLGIRQVDLGEYVSPEASLVTLQAFRPLYVDFTLPQKHLAQIGEGRGVQLTVDAYPERIFSAEITAIEPKVAQETRNFKVRATLSNKKEWLRPGMFAQVTVGMGKEREWVTLPQTAVTSNPYGESVYVVKEADNAPATVTKRFVTTGARRGDQVAVRKGVKSGQTVVTSGQIKLREDAPIRVNNAVQPSNDPSPRPENR